MGSDRGSDVIKDWPGDSREAARLVIDEQHFPAPHEDLEQAVRDGEGS